MFSCWYRCEVSHCSAKSRSSRARHKRQTFQLPSVPVDIQVLRPCNSLHLQLGAASRDWIRMPQDASITYWNDGASNWGLFPVRSLFQISRSGQKLFPSNSNSCLHLEVSGWCRQCHPGNLASTTQLMGGPSLPFALGRATGVTPTDLCYSPASFPLCPLYFHPSSQVYHPNPPFP